ALTARTFRARRRRSPFCSKRRASCRSCSERVNRGLSGKGGVLMQRMGMVLGLKPEAIAEYKRIHADVWPSVLAVIAACNMRNYSIYLREPENLLFASFEYHGTDYAADSARMAADPEMQRWWSICMPMQSPLSTRAEGEWWTPMEEVFHVD